MVHLYNGIPPSHKQEWNHAIGGNMDEHRDHPTKWSQSERQKQPPYNIIHVCNLKCGTKEYLQSRNGLTDTDLWLQKEGGRKRDALSVWGSQMQPITFRMDKQGPTVYSTEN